MHIKDLILENWKGITANYQLAPVTIVVGDNMCGKTAVADAIRVGLLGYSPRHGKRAAQTFGFIGSEQGAASGGIRLGFSDNTGLNHSWRMKRGKISHEGPEALEMMPPVLLDFSTYLGMSGPDKIRFVFGQMNLEAEDLAPSNITARIKRACAKPDATKAGELALQDVLESVEAHWDGWKQTGGPAQEWIKSMIASFKEQAKKERDAVGVMTGVIQGTSQLGSAEAVEDFNPDDIKIIQEELAKWRGEQRAQAERKARNDRLALTRKTQQDLLLSTPDPTEEIETIERSIKTLWEEVRGYQSRTVHIETVRATRKIGIQIAEKTVAEWKDLIEKQEQELHSTLASSCCPLCKSEGEGWKASYKAHMLTRINKDKADSEKHSSRLAKLKDDDASDAQAERKSKAEDERIQGLARTLDQELSKLKLLEQRKASISNAKAVLEQLPQPETGDDDDHSTKIQTLETCLQTLENKQKRHNARLADAKRVAEAQASIEEHEAKSLAYTEAMKSLEKLQEELMTKAFTTITAKATKLTSCIMPQALTFRDGEVGYLRGASWVALSYFSGTEDLLTVAGLAVAMASTSPIKIVLMDELGRLTEKNKDKLVTRAEALVKEGFIDQFVGIDVQAPVWAMSNLTKILELK